MTLVLEIDYLAGVCFAAIGPDSPEPDWPPQPDRIFSALVATWAARGKQEAERRALEWLEQQSVPELQYAEGLARTPATVFVPPNDPRSDKKKHAKGVIPTLRSRQPRRFPAMRLNRQSDSWHVRLSWPHAEPDENVFTALADLARDMSYIGHSTSLTRCRFLLGHDAADQDDAGRTQRRIYPGRFAELRKSYDAGRRPSPGAYVAPVKEAGRERTNIFADRWLLLEHVAGEMPDIRACALVARSIRDALMSGYRKAGLEGKIPEEVSGHDADGKPTRLPHLAIVPLAYAGFRHADGHVMSFALIPPTEGNLLDGKDFRAALRKAAPVREAYGRRILTVRTRGTTASEDSFSLRLSPTFEIPAGKRSLNYPRLYLGPTATFATVTPMVLDRHLKEKGEAREREIADQIAAACRNTGLPEPESVVVDKHSAVVGAPSAYPSGKSPHWLRWRLPPSLGSRQLTHAVIQFAEPVVGPVILGAGRFFGLGLCRPIDPETR